MKKILVVLALSSIAASQAFAGQVAYLTIKGAKQGAFKGEVVSVVHKDAILVRDFSYEVESPRDPASGLPTGKRMHKPVTISKIWGAASPQLLNALATNENLTTVTIEFYETSTTGTEELASTLKLTNATISDIKQDYAVTSVGELPQNSQVVSFTFQKIEITDKSGTTYSDDWQAQ
jgi:type VI secretion system secreted protein Hcp